MPVEYKKDDVLTAARKRIAAVFDRFDRVNVSVSGGKDSAVLFDLAYTEAQRRGRRIGVFFLDQEAEYASTIEIIEGMMARPNIDPLWLQVPIKMTNATSFRADFLYAWGPGEEWMRDKHSLATPDLPGHPERFYSFFPWFESQVAEKTAWLIGLRSKESLNRFRSVSSKPGFEDIEWSTRTKSPLSYRFYPIYDWTFGDVWKYIADNSVAYNRYYDRMFALHGSNMRNMRVSNLIHEKSFRCLSDLQEFEPETYERLLKRVPGIHAAALYAREKTVYDARSLPKGFQSWMEWRDYLLETTPTERRDRFRRRFGGQADDPETCRQQVRQILINDWEGNVPVSKSASESLRALWWNRL